jgi:hypothetical protein
LRAAAKYNPESFIDQAVHMIEKFSNQHAAFLASRHLEGGPTARIIQDFSAVAAVSALKWKAILSGL